MPSTRVLRRRIRAARSTKQITRAQEMVATAKLRQSITNATNSEPFADNLERLLTRLFNQFEYSIDHPWLHEHVEKPVLVVIIASDQGLAGTFTSNLLRQAVQLHEKYKERGIMVLPIGRRIQSSLHRHRYPLADVEVSMPRHPGIADAENLATLLIDTFRTGKVGAIELVSTRYRSPLFQEPVVLSLFPVSIPKQTVTPAPLFEPDATEVLESILTQLLVGRIYEAFLASKAAEYAARRTAMHAATDNAGKLIDRLTLTYNRVRQAAITTEIAEIVGGAAALSS